GVNVCSAWTAHITRGRPQRAARTGRRKVAPLRGAGPIALRSTNIQLLTELTLLMKLKLIILSLYLIAAVTPGVLNAAQSAQERDCEAQKSKCDDAAAQVKKLDLKGVRGLVCFRHKPHEAFLNPDAEFVHKAGAGSECAACHHKRSPVTGAPILAKCG